MPETIESHYDHEAVEEKIYKQWEESGYFNPDNLEGEPFTIIMPPANANGALHIGHAVGMTLQDIMIRFWRMKGRKTLWLPGADHAGFETQVVFDKKIEKEGRNRFAMGREELWKEIWDFTQENKKTMENQIRKLGASCDWSREKFTLDPDIVEETQKTFVKLYEEELIYRDLRVINWCPKHKTALSDLEVKYVERTDPLYYIKYGPLTLATVRPETKFGDTALAVNPKDSRYKKFIGKEIEAQGILGHLKFKVIGDDAIDPEFGTGVVKITPAHDAVDFEIWQRHKDEIPGPKIVIDENGRLTGEVGNFKGLKVAEAREKVAEAMKKIGILEKVDTNYVHQVATCYKCGTTLEPRPLPQWYLKMKPLAAKAIEAVRKGETKIHPKSQEKVYFHWLENVRDWNISRQIVWGIRIPAWFCLGCGKVKVNPKIKSRWFIVRHGESVWNTEGRTQGQLDENNPLSKEGKAQVEDAAEKLKTHNIGLIVSSDLERCRMTAEIIAKATGAEILFDKGLRERNLGEAEGNLREKNWEKFGKELLWQYETAPPGGETWKELEERVWEAFKKLKDAHGHKNVVVVSHGGAIRTIAKRMRNWSFDEMVANKRSVENAEVIPVDIAEPCTKCGSDASEQDPDVFDTWFSSGQWPYLALGYPKNKDYNMFYPTNVMETGYDILFFWVARMIMFGLYRTGKVPFKDAHLHGLVRDKDRQKMSKSKGNVVDPLGVAETYGTDAVRMALVVGNTAGNDIIISEDKIRGYRNFATKIWNVARFILMNRSEVYDKKVSVTAEDKKNIDEVIKLKAEAAKHIENFEFHLAAEKIYHYIWHTFADKIIESYKPRLKDNDAAAYQTLEEIFMESLKMLHPFMPFVTEEIYQKFRPFDKARGKPGKMLMIEKW